MSKYIKAVVFVLRPVSCERLVCRSGNKIDASRISVTFKLLIKAGNGAAHRWNFNVLKLLSAWRKVARSSAGLLDANVPPSCVSDQQEEDVLENHKSQHCQT